MNHVHGVVKIPIKASKTVALLPLKASLIVVIQALHVTTNVILHVTTAFVVPIVLR